MFRELPAAVVDGGGCLVGSFDRQVRFELDHRHVSQTFLKSDSI